MLKKLLIAAGIIAVTMAPAYAANGDVVCPIYSSDIITKLDGREIQTYSLDGRMMIAVEDLVPYGYSVSWDGDTNTLIAVKTGEADKDFNPSFGRGDEGRQIGYMYESDITVFLNGKRTDAYSIGGKMVVCAEEIADGTMYPNEFLDSAEYRQADYDECDRRSKIVSDYWMTHWWDEDNRVLYLYNTSEGFVDIDRQKKIYETSSEEYGGTPPYEPYSNTPLSKAEITNATVYNNYFGGDAHAGYWNSLCRVNTDGTVYDYTDICVHYGICYERKARLSLLTIYYAPVMSRIEGQPEYIRRITGEQKTGVLNLNTMMITDIKDIES